LTKAIIFDRWIKLGMNSIKNILNKKIKKGDIHRALDKIIYSRLFKKKIYLIIIISVLSIFFLLENFHHINIWDVDAPSYYTAAKGITQNINIYDEEEFQNLASSLFGKSVLVFPYLYWPVLAQIFVPLSYLNPYGYFQFLFFFNVLMTFLCIFLIYCLLGLKNRKTNLPVIYLFLLIAYNIPLYSNLRNGQINLLVLNLVLASFLLLSHKKQFASSLLLCFAILFKIYPILLLALFFFQKKYRYIIYSFINFIFIFSISSLLFSINHWYEFIKMAMNNFLYGKQSEFFFDFGIQAHNNSLNGFLSQIFLRNNLSRSYVLPVILLLILIIIVVFRSKLKSLFQIKDMNLSLSLILMLTLIFSVITWHHHYIIMIFPLAYFFNRILIDKRYIYFLPLILLSFFIFYSNTLGGGLPFNQARLISTILLLIILLYYYFSRKTIESK